MHDDHGEELRQKKRQPGADRVLRRVRDGRLRRIPCTRAVWFELDGGWGSATAAVVRVGQLVVLGGDRDRLSAFEVVQ